MDMPEIDRKAGHRRPMVVLAWVVVVILSVLMAFLAAIPRPSQGEGEPRDEAGLAMTHLQLRYLLGVASLTREPDLAVSQAVAMLDTGSVEQRQRVMAFTLAMGDSAAALEVGAHLQEDVLRVGRPLDTTQAAIAAALTAAATDGVSALDDQQRKFLQDHLGWCGDLLFATGEDRDLIKRSAVTRVLALYGVIAVGVVVALLGLIGLIVLLTCAFGGSLRSKLGSASVRHGMYAETFALWMVLFLTLSIVSGVLTGGAMDVVSLCVTLGAMFTSLASLAWPVFRGVSWSEVRSDLGWSRGRGFVREVLAGFAGFAMTMPIIGAGLLLTLLLMVVQGLFHGGGDAFAGTGGPAHPIIVELASGSTASRVVIVLLAAVAAPLVEETMFRGVLYRQVRTAFARLGTAMSIVLSTLVVSFVFALIHPQGWVAIPALMSIAIGMTLVREWRGSLIASIVVHATNNGIIVGMLILLLS
jgi:membrane protease YdiL (CAAX protease family)